MFDGVASSIDDRRQRPEDRKESLGFCPLSSVICPLTLKHPAGVEPAHPPWQGGTQPLHHGCIAVFIYHLSSQQGRQDSNPHRTVLEAVVLPLHHTPVTTNDEARGT